MGRSEELVKDTLFHVSDRSGNPIGSYTSDGMSEPHCFASLKPGDYLVAVEAASGTQPTSDQRWSVTLSQGTSASVDFGSRPSQQQVETSAGGADAIGLVLTAVVLGGIGVLIYRQRKGSAGIS